MEAGIWVGYGVEFLLAIGVLSWILKKRKLPSWLKKNDGESPPPVCKSEVCQKLNDCMVRYMKKLLAFEDESEELEMVKRQLVEQIKVHSGDDLTGSYISLKHIERTRSEGRRRMMQCLRTTLVAHPDDIRGRRRANVARQILINHVYEEPDCFFKIESGVEEITKSCLSPETRFKLSKAFCWINATKAVLLWFLDVYSDVSVIFAIMYSIDQIARFKTANELMNESEDIMRKCNISNTTELQAGLQVAENVLTKYVFQLRLVFFLSTFVQCFHGAIQMAITHGVFNNFARSLLLFGLNVVAAPITNLKIMLKATTEFQDPEKEGTTKLNEYTKEVSRNRSRYEFKILEAFRESLGSCRIQMAFYFAFSYIVGKEYENVNCMTKSLLGSDEGIFTIDSTQWHGMPRLVFSALMSLVSISLAQVSVYKTRHEFDMNILGKICYTLSTFLATFVKLSIHTISYATVLIASIDPKRSDVQFGLFVSQLLVFVFQLQIMFIVDWVMAKEGGAGYCLNVNSAFIWPTSANLSTERQRLRELKVDNTKLFFPKMLTKIYTRLCKDTLKMFNKLPAPQKAVLWIPTSLFLASQTPAKLGRFPSQYGFQSSVTSRKRFQARFSASLGEYEICIYLRKLKSVTKYHIFRS